MGMLRDGMGFWLRRIYKQRAGYNKWFLITGIDTPDLRNATASFDSSSLVPRYSADSW